MNNGRGAHLGASHKRTYGSTESTGKRHTMSVPKQTLSIDLMRKESPRTHSRGGPHKMSKKTSVKAEGVDDSLNNSSVVAGSTQQQVI